jgi:predicted nucleic acid-binding protein
MHSLEKKPRKELLNWVDQIKKQRWFPEIAKNLKILIDTSVWINHLKEPVAELNDLLNNHSLIVMHPFVLQELLLSNSKKSEVLYRELSLFPFINIAGSSEIENFLLEYPVRGKGLGLIDIHLLYSAWKDKVRLLTHDKKLMKVYKEFVNKN